MSQPRHSNGSAAAGPSRLPTYVASAPRKSSSSSASQAVNGISTPRRSNGPRKSSAFEAFDAPAYCNNMAAFIADQLANRSPKAKMQDSAAGETSHDGWRGGDPRPLAIPSTPSRLADVSVQTATGDDDAGISEDDEEDEDEDERGDEDEDEDDIDFARTRKTREAAQAFLQQVQGQSADLTETEKSLEEQALALFGAATDGGDEVVTGDAAAESDIQPEVAAQIAGMLAEEKKSSGRPMIEVMNQDASDDDSDSSEEDEESEGGDSIGEESEADEEFSDEEEEEGDEEEEFVEDAQAVPMQVPQGSFELDELEDNDDEQDGSAAGDGYLDGSMEDEEEEVEDDDEGEAGNDERDLDIYTNGGNLYADAPHTSTPDEPIELLDSSDEEAEDMGEEEPADYAEGQEKFNDEMYQGENDALPHTEPSVDEGVPVSANIFEQTDIPLDPSAWMSSLVGGELSNEQQDVEQTAGLVSDALTASQAEPVSAADQDRSIHEASANSPPIDVPPPAQDLQQNMASGTQLLSLKKEVDVALPDASKPASVTVQPGTPQRANSPPGTIPSPAQDLQQGMTSGAQLLSLKKHIDIALPDASKPPSLAVQPGTPQRATSVEHVRRAGDGTARHARDLFDIKNIVSDAAGGTPSLGTSLLSDVDTVPRDADEGHGDVPYEAQDDQLKSVAEDEIAVKSEEPRDVAVSITEEAVLPTQADNGTTAFAELDEYVQEDPPAEVSGHAEEEQDGKDSQLDASTHDEARGDQAEDELIDYEEAQGVSEEAFVQDGEPVEEVDVDDAGDEAEKDKLIAEVPANEDDVNAHTEQQAIEIGEGDDQVVGTEQDNEEDAPPTTIEELKDEEEPTKPLPRRSTRARTTSTQDASISPVITKRSLRSATPRAASEAPSETSRSAKKKRRSPRKSDAAGDLADFIPDEIREEEGDDDVDGRRAKRARTEEKQEEPTERLQEKEEEEAEVFDTSILEEKEEPMEVDKVAEEEEPHKQEAHDGGEEVDEGKAEGKKRKRSPRKSGPRKSADPTFRVTKVEESSSEEDEEAVEKKQKKEEAAKAKKEAEREKRRILREAKKQEKEEEQKEAKEAERAAAGVVRGKRRTSEDAKTFRPDKGAEEGDGEEEEEETSAGRKTRPRRSRRKASQTPGQE